MKDIVSVYEVAYDNWCGWCWHRTNRRLDKIVSESGPPPYYKTRAQCLRWAKKLNPGCEFVIEGGNPTSGRLMRGFPGRREDWIE